MKNSKLVTVICGTLSIFLTVLIYVLSSENIFTVPIRWISLMFLVMAECLGMIKALLAEKCILSQVGIYTSCAHLLAVIVISVLFVNLFSTLFKLYIILNIFMLCVMAILDLFTFSVIKNISNNNKKIRESKTVMDACYSKVQGLSVTYGHGDYKKDLIEVADLIKYSDNSELTGDEEAIMFMIGELETGLKENSENISAQIFEIKNAINLRTIKMKSIKRGGI